MDIQAEKIALTKLLLNTNNPSIIQSIKDIFSKAEPNDFWDELSSDQQEEIDTASKQLDAGEYVSLEEFMSKHR